MNNSLPHDDDFIWVRRLVQGDEHAFKSLFDKYKDVLYRYSLKLTKAEESAEEIVHDVFLKIWNQRRKINPELSFKAYLYRITRNTTLNFLRKSACDLSLRNKLVSYFQRVNNDTEDTIFLSDYEELASKAVQLLPPQQQLVYTLSRIKGLSHDEIAQNLGLSRGTVKNHMGYALKFIRKYLTLHTDILPIFIYSAILVLQ